MRALAGRALERALRRTVALDPDTQAQLRALEGRRIVIHLRGPELVFSVSVVDARLCVGPPPDEDHDTSALRVATTPGSVLAMAFAQGDAQVAPGRVEIAGDAALARQVESLVRNFRPDVEEAFAQRFGDVLGVPLSRALHRGLSAARRGASQAVEDLADWLREESRLAVAPAEMDTFLDDVDALRERTERLRSRLDRLAQRTESSA